MIAGVNDWNTKIIEEFRAHHGVVGGPFEGMRLLLLHTTGARSGAERVNPIAYDQDGDRLFVFASAAGSDKHPDWFHNLVAQPEVTVEVGDETFAATATPLGEPDRSERYDAMATKHPGFREYEQKTDRVIPVVELTRR